jgi:glycosyltransferase involved in cell wall biosynthesis
MFSVIMPVYNGGKFIETAIESVMAQTLSDWELVIVDDGSKDDTPQILKKYSKHDKIHIITQSNQGVSAARNCGMLAAKGNYFAFLDSDDIWYKEHLAIMQDLIEKYPSAGLYGTFTKAELQNGKEIAECNFFKNREEIVYLEDFFEEYYKDSSAKMFTVITTCISREAFEKTGGFPVGCKIGEDLELSLKIAAYYPVVLSKKCTATYKKRNSIATKDKSFDPDWGFFHTVEYIYCDEEIPLSKRENLKKVMQWFSMRRYRHYMIEGKRKKAIKVYQNTNKKWLSKKDRMINLALLFLPSAAIYKIFSLRWRGKA